MGHRRHPADAGPRPPQPARSEEKRRADVCGDHRPRPWALRHQPARGRAPRPRLDRLRRRKRADPRAELPGAFLSRQQASRWYWVAALLILLAGLADFAVYVVKSLDNLVDSLAEVTAPGTVELTFTETGAYTVFMEMEEAQPAAKLNVRLFSRTTGAFVPVEPATTLKFYVWGDRRAVAVKEFRIDQPGLYELDAFFSANPRETPAILTIGHNWGERFSNIFVTGLAGLLAWWALAGVIAAIPLIRKQPADAQPSAATPSDGDAVHRLRFHGSGGELFGIFVVNVLLTLLTLGVYSFWAKVRTRRYLWGQTEFAADRFNFHGTGRELLIGWLKAMVLFGGLVVTARVLPPMLWNDPRADAAGQLLLAVGFVVLIPLAIVGSMRYRLNRTSWRGVRFSFHGGYRELLGVMLWSFLFTGLTLGLYIPFYQTNLRRFLAGHSRFGSTSLAFDGEGRALLGRFVLTLLLTLPTLGLVWLWYLAFQRRYYWDHTSFASARFHCTVTGVGLLGLYAVNLAIIVLSLGLALPWATVRTRRYDMENLVLQGPVDIEHITQQAQTATPTGEELSGFLDVDALPG
ncbi:MAG: DUF898 domain-containing protein [Nitrospirae bacterium]|nr:MAG: DUF898 domain-containing protein [Nitrospirota bacterium]